MLVVFTQSAFFSFFHSSFIKSPQLNQAIITARRKQPCFKRMPRHAIDVALVCFIYTCTATVDLLFGKFGNKQQTERKGGEIDVALVCFIYTCTALAV